MVQMGENPECPECFGTDTVVKEQKDILVCKTCGAITPMSQLKG